MTFLQPCGVLHATIPSSIRGERVMCGVPWHATSSRPGPTREARSVHPRRHRRRSDGLPFEESTSNHPRTACPERWFRPANPKHAFARQVTLRLRCIRIQLQLLASICRHQPLVLCPLVPTLRALVPIKTLQPRCSSIMSSPLLGAHSTFAPPVNVSARAKLSSFMLVSCSAFQSTSHVDEWCRSTSRRFMA